MELNLPNTAVCPLCEDEQVPVKENKNGRPSVFCNTFQTPMNFRGDKERRESFLSTYVSQATEETTEPEQEAAGLDEEPEETDDSDEGNEIKSMADIISNAENDKEDN